MAEIAEIRKLVDIIYESIEDKADYLGELDGKSGDGDLGLSMKAAFRAIKNSVDSSLGDDLGKTMMEAAIACNKAAPSTMGTLISAGLMNTARSIKGKKILTDEDIIRIPRLFADGIMQRGKAKLGDKTILDALAPMAETAEMAFSSGVSIEEAFLQAAEKARESAEKTAGMKANVGRAHWLGDRAAAYPDGGAMLCAIVANAVVKKY